jgi:hypothetical protein
VFFATPLVIAGLALYYGVGFNYDVLYALLTAFSIFAGLLLNLLLLVFSFSEKSQNSTTLQPLRKQLLRELHSNISFSILTSIAIVAVAMFCVVQVKLPRSLPTGTYTGRVSTFFLAYFISNFVLTLLMILKRMHILLSQALRESSLKRTA